jgi:SPOR domain
MSRNGPTGFSGARAQAQARRPLPDDPFTAPPTGQNAPQWPPQYADPQPQQQPTPHPLFGQRAPAPQPAYGQPQQPAYAQQQSQQGYYFPQGATEPEPAPAYAPQPAASPLAYESAAPFAPQAQQQAHTVPRWPAQSDPRGFDLGNYMPASAQQSPFHQQQPAPFPHAAEPAQNLGGEFDAAGLRQHDPSHFDSQQGYGETDADYDELLADDDDQPRRGRRGMMIAAALVGAIGLGGALAYTYKTLLGPSSGPAPRITASNAGPTKVKPVVPDGKSFPNTDKKLLNRLGEEESGNASNRVVIGVPPPQAQQDASDDRASDDASGPRKVRIIPISPNAPQQGAGPVTTGSAPARAAAPPILAVPGVTLENVGPPLQQGPPSAARATLPPQQPPQVQAKAPPPPPPAVKVASVAKADPPTLPTTEPVRKAAPVAAAPAAAPVAREPVVKAPVPKTKTASAGPAVATSAASGYVAVLASKKSRMDALKAFADMQQKYNDVLGSRTPDVQESDQSARGLGTMYRLVVGPPGSREAASGVCSQLKTAGYKDCWVTQY